MPLTDLMPFRDALASVEGKTVLPTTLSSAELSGIESRLKRMATFSARTDNAQYLQTISDAIEDVLNPKPGTRADRVTEANPEGNVTEGMNPAQARVKLKDALKLIGYQPEEGEAGTLKDLSSDRRIDLVVKTNVQMAQGAGHFVQGQDPGVLDAFPAQELVRFEHHGKERDWHARWREAADASGDDDAPRVLSEFGRMVARKDSPIWDALGDPDLFADGLGNPYPPFAFNSGMWVQDVDFEEAKKMGLVTDDTEMEPQELEFADPEVPDFADAALKQALIDSLGSAIEFTAGGILRAAIN